MIRKATIKDLKDVSKVYISSINKDNNNEPFIFYKRYIKNRILHDYVFVKEVNGKIIGAYVGEKNNFGNPYTFNKIPYNTFWSTQLMVYEEYQGMGYGKELMNHYFIFGKELDIKSYRIICQEKLVTYYERMEFIIVEKAKTHKKSDWYYIMERKIQ